MEFPQDFTARERALLGARFDELYAYATPQPARGVTVNALRCTPEWFAQHADFDAKPSPFCPTAFTTAADFRPVRRRGRPPAYRAAHPAAPPGRRRWVLGRRAHLHGARGGGPGGSLVPS